jgi:xanthine dehydrogenase accessory factor
VSRRTAARMAELAGRRVPFVHATVVRAEAPASAHAGDDAIVLADGTIEGFVGGRCAEQSVRTAALDTLRAGRSLLLRVLPDGADAFPESAGARVAVNPCLSGGALEIFLRPELPAPVVRVVGSTPAADAVAALAAALELEVVRAEAGDDLHRPVTAVVVASHGADEEEPAIRAALDAGVGYVGLVASRRRGAAVLASLDLDEGERERVHTPAGLPLGAATPPEVALSILAEIVRAIRVDGLTAPPAGVREVHDHGDVAGQGHHEVHDHGHHVTAAAAVDVVAEAVVDPVCGMSVVPGPKVPRLERNGVTTWFCSTGCRDAFVASQA